MDDYPIGVRYQQPALNLRIHWNIRTGHNGPKVDIAGLIPILLAIEMATAWFLHADDLLMLANDDFEAAPIQKEILALDSSLVSARNLIDQSFF